MNTLTAEQIAKQTDNKNGISNIRAINKIYRAQDESHLWPIRGRFSATERAIRKARKFKILGGLEYCYTLENIIGNIVNDPKNW